MKKFITFFILTAMIVVLPGCIKFKSDEAPEESQSIGGIFKSEDKAQTFSPYLRVATAGDERLTIAGFNIKSFAMDPNDNNAIYIGTEGQGMFFSYDGGVSWLQWPSLSEGVIQSIAVHPKNKCTIFATTANSIIKTEDCSRTWQKVYFDTRTNITVSSIQIDSFEPEIIYAGTSNGEVLQSRDGGKSWQTIHRVNSYIVEIIIAKDTRTVYVGTDFNGIFKTKDKGKTWTRYYDEIKEDIKGSGSDELTDLAMDYKNNVLLFSAKHGIVKTADEGEKWENVPIITPPGSTVIYSLAVNPEDSNEIYYGTASSIIITYDGGTNWDSKQLPTASLPLNLFVDPFEPNNLYLGFKRREE